ncbi:FkbM family methyltransferase [Prochlorococcus marinus]|uniref:SAM-dependent methyltransferase n=1 Tax=Prochlorococcus marinus (strain AS9601) TaxID=146891 RepID=A2BSH3_PROMS|nr:FkbM family methyltransferase [Prochlorococcus marinus]ABM70734.1 SAM-dependent methyltransferase [Prochlorococcus marinus str. AS9601]
MKNFKNFKLKRFIYKLVINLVLSNEKIKKRVLAISSKVYADIENFNYDPESNGEYWLLKNLSTNYSETILDIGANIGEYSLKCYKYFPKSKIYAIEASPKTYKKLIKNTSNVLNIFTINKALSDSSEKKYFYERSDFSGRNTFEGKNTGLTYKNKIIIELIKGDYFLSEEGIEENIKIMKVDVEGYELKVLKGFENSLKNFKIDIIQFERSTAACTPSIFEFYDFLSPYGYYIGKLYPKYIEIYKNYKYTLEEYIGCNWIAVNKNSESFKSLNQKIKFIDEPPRRIG